MRFWSTIRTITERRNMIFNPAHPGEVLRDYLGEMTVGEAAARLRITRAHLSRILNGRAGITAAMSLRLSTALGKICRLLDQHAGSARPLARSKGAFAESPPIPAFLPLGKRPQLVKVFPSPSAKL